MKAKKTLKGVREMVAVAKSTSKVKIIERAEEFLDVKVENEKTNRHYKLKRLFFEDLEEIFNQLQGNNKWSKLKVREKREVVRKFLRKVLSLYLNPEYLHDKTFQKTKEFTDIRNFEKVKVAIKYVRSIGCHPSPEDFRPRLRLFFDKEINKPVVLATIYEDAVYESNKHYNTISLDKLEIKETPNGFVGLVVYSLYRRNLDFGRYKEFAFLFGYEDGAIFTERIPPVSSIEEALGWLKPAEVKKAEKEGRLVLRQGDVFFVELKSKRKNIFDYYKEGKLPRNHIPVEENGKIYIKHHEHSHLELPHPYFKPVVRKTLDVFIGRGRWD